MTPNPEPPAAEQKPFENDGQIFCAIFVELIKCMGVDAVIVKQGTYDGTWVLSMARKVSVEVANLRAQLQAAQERVKELEMWLRERDEFNREAHFQRDERLLEISTGFKAALTAEQSAHAATKEKAEGLDAACDYGITAMQALANLNDDEAMEAIILDCANRLGEARTLYRATSQPPAPDWETLAKGLADRLDDIHTTAHCIEKAGPTNTRNLQEAFNKFGRIAIMATAAIADFQSHIPNGKSSQPPAPVKAEGLSDGKEGRTS